MDASNLHLRYQKYFRGKGITSFSIPGYGIWKLKMHVSLISNKKEKKWLNNGYFTMSRMVQTVDLQKKTYFKQLN